MISKYNYALCLLKLESYNESIATLLEYMIEDENILEENYFKNVKKIKKNENLTLLADFLIISGKFKQSLKYEELLYRKTNDYKYLINQLKCYFRMKNFTDSLKILEILININEIDPKLKQKAYVDKNITHFFMEIFESYDQKKKFDPFLLNEEILNLAFESEGILFKDYEVEFFKGVIYFYKNEFLRALNCFENALSFYQKPEELFVNENANKWDKNKNSTIDFCEMNFNIAIASIQVSKKLLIMPIFLNKDKKFH